MREEPIDMGAYDREQQIVRAVLSLVQAATNQENQDLRDDLLDDAAILIRMGIDKDTAVLTRFCRETATHIERAVTTPHIVIARVIQCLLRIASSASIPDNPPVPKQPRQKVPLTLAGSRGHENRQKIIVHIREHADVRMGDIVTAFSGVFSDRTVKRALKDLMAQGMIKRFKQEGVIRYKVIDV